MKTNSSLRFSRRHFLRTSALLTTALATPQVLTHRVLAASGAPGANDRIGIGIIGMGRMMGGHLRHLVSLPEARLVAVADELAGKGAEVFATSGRVRTARSLPRVRTGHPLTDPIALIVSFYAMVEAVARARGIDSDRPRHLRNVTETL